MAETNLIGELNMIKEAGAKPNFSDLARRYGMDRHTVARMWNGGAGAPGDGRSARPSGFDAHIDEIARKAAVPGMTVTAIHEWLLDAHPGEALPGYGALKHFVRARGIRVGEPAPEPHPRFETEPGRQLQFDWKERLLLRGPGGEEFRFNAWSATLGWSRRHVYMRSNTITTDDFVACALQTAARLGGVPPEWLTDNMSALVTVGADGARRRSERAFRFAREAGFEIVLCAPRTPQTKGKVESANRFLNRLLAYDGEVRSWADVDAAIARVEARSNEEPSRSTGLPPAALFAREKDLLLPVDVGALSALAGEVSRQRVPATMLVRSRGREYSVPRRCVGRDVRVVRMPGGQLRVWMGGELVAVHDTSASDGAVNYSEAHYAEALAGKRWAADRDIEEAARENLRLLGGLGGAS